MEITEYYHKNSDVVAFKRIECKDGDWFECTYDEQGNEVSHKDSSGFWNERTYDEKGNELTYKSSNGYFRIKGKEVTEEEFNNFIKSKQ